MTSVAVSGSFDDPRSGHVRFLDEVAKIGDLHVMLWSDEVATAIDGKPPKFPLAERKYFVEAIKFVQRVSVVEQSGERDVAAAGEELWVMGSATGRQSGRAISEEKLKTFPTPAIPKSISAAGRKKVLVTGCFDWVHTGHVRFFEEVSELGDVYAVVGSDANIELLKGAGHPLFRQNERCYMVGAVRYVKLAVV